MLRELLEKKQLPEELKKRLQEELKEIESCNEENYFLDLCKNKVKYKNENNLLVSYVLGICDDFDPNKPPKYVYGDYPDVDVDFLPDVRSILKEQFARNQFGDDYVCNVATYTKFDIKSTILDMARVLGLDRNEALFVTKQLGPKDDEGELLTWDKAMEIYDDLKAYTEKYPELAEAVKKLLHRNRNMGVHASGLIISGVPIKEYVPLVRPKQNQSASAWVEGLHGTDLGAVGFIKFDLLSLKANAKIATACKLANTPIAALKGQGNWTDTSYLNDTDCLNMANRGDLKMIFQFDGSEGIRKLAKQGGVDSFNDLVAYTALYRPGCMKLKMHESYCNRKKGKESYTIHPKLDFLKKTYGVLVYQEDAMRVLNVVGKIPMKDCENVRKAISKKKVDKFKQYKEMFIKNGQELFALKEVEKLWSEIEAFAGYAFNLSHAVAYTYISSRMLYLKRHHPLAFYTAFLQYVDPTGPKDYKKLREYIKDIELHDIKIKKLNPNSKSNFSIHENDIIYGFSKIKGIGIETSNKIESLSPFKNYEDFLERFGGNNAVNEAVIGLNIFQEDPIKCYEKFVIYKSKKKQKLKLDKIEKTIKLFMSDEVEEYFYGFSWENKMEKSKKFNKHSFEKLEIEDCYIGPVEITIKSVQETKKNVTYYKIAGEDYLSQTRYITVWKDDFERWKDELKVGNIVRLSVKKPTPPYSNYTLAPVGSRYSKPPKEFDSRVVLL